MRRRTVRWRDVWRTLAAGSVVAFGTAASDQIGWLPLSERDGFRHALPDGLLAGAAFVAALLALQWGRTRGETASTDL